MKNKFNLSIIIALIITLGWAVVSESVVANISSGVIRLHILANSDSFEDQKLKLAVRDTLLKETSFINKEKPDIHKIERICRKEIMKQGYSYDVSALYGNFYFPTKGYENIVLPAGKYQAVRVIIGEGKGRNWWCVMYPPLCYSGFLKGKINKEELDALQYSMKSDNYNLVSENVIKIKPTFKIVELWNKLRYKE